MQSRYESVSGGIDWNNAVVTLRPVGAWMEYIFGAYVFFTVPGPCFSSPVVRRLFWGSPGVLLHEHSHRHLRMDLS